MAMPSLSSFRERAESMPIPPRTRFPIIDEKEDEFAGFVVHTPWAGGAQALDRPANAGLLRHLVKPAIAAIVKQMIATNRGDEDIRQTIVVEVANSHAHAVKN